MSYRLSNLLAAVGRAQLSGLPAKIKRRREIFANYERELSRHGIEFMPEMRDGQCTRWLSVGDVSLGAGAAVSDVRTIELDPLGEAPSGVTLLIADSVPDGI